MKIKKAVIFGLLTVFLALAVTVCSETDTDDGDGDDTTSVITYTVVQTGGTGGLTDSTGIVFEFSASIESLAADEITVGDKAKGSAEVNGSGTSWTLPITVTAAGLATVTIDKDGIETDTKYVLVHKDGQGIRDTGEEAQGGTLAEKLEWVKTWVNQKIKDMKDNEENIQTFSGQTFIIKVNAGEQSMPSMTLSYPLNGIALILESDGGEGTISLSDISIGSLFIVESGVTLILEDSVILEGGDSGSSSLVRVNSGGTLYIEAGAKIKNNAISSSYATNGGGVFVSGGTLIMDGGEISGNTASSESHFGSFGGGVYVNGGTFVLKDGIITGNTASSGGGVRLNSGTFIMDGGEISGNVASTNGGGVFVSGGTFVKTGGTIYGYDGSDANSNAVKDSSDAVIDGRGHAVYVSEALRRETTAGPGDNLDSGKSAEDGGGWDN